MTIADHIARLWNRRQIRANRTRRRVDRFKRLLARLDAEYAKLHEDYCREPNYTNARRMMQELWIADIERQRIKQFTGM